MITLDDGGKRVAFQDKDQHVEVIDDEGTAVDSITFAPRRLPLQALDLSPDGRELVVSTKDGEAIWYEVDGIEAKVIADLGAGYDAQFLTDGHVAVVGGGAAQIIDPRSPTTETRLALGVDATRLAVDQTGRLLATADATGSIQLWDADDVEPIGAALQVGDIATAVPIRFSADGRYLLISGSAETTWLNVSTADWPRIACSLVTTRLTRDERARYLGSRESADTCP
jgi:WD40 repeat protein